MNEKIEQLVNEAGHTTLPNFSNSIDPIFAEKFAELIVKECVTTLEFHGYDDAVPYVKWMATNKLGVKE